MKFFKIISFLIKKTCQIGLILVAAWIFLSLAVLFGMYSCTGNYDISKKEPFKQAIGKHFVLQKDLQIYQFNDQKKVFYLGDVTHLSGNFSNGIPKIIDKSSIGVVGEHITIYGIAKIGTVVTIKSVIKKVGFSSTSYSYSALLSNNSFIKEVDTSKVINTFHNPPYTPHWSDPPIFDPKAALPLPSDGIWWK